MLSFPYNRISTGGYKLGQKPNSFEKQLKLSNSLPDIGDIIIIKQAIRLSHLIWKSLWLMARPPLLQHQATPPA